MGAKVSICRRGDGGIVDQSLDVSVGGTRTYSEWKKDSKGTVPDPNSGDEVDLDRSGRHGKYDLLSKYKIDLDPDESLEGGENQNETNKDDEDLSLETEQEATN